MKPKERSPLLDAGRMSFSRVYVPPGRLSDVIRDRDPLYPYGRQGI